MKKTLSMVLALVMTVSLLTFAPASASAAFTDSNTITYKEAVDVIYSLGIMSGYSDGSFRPTGLLTRGAAAKIICGNCGANYVKGMTRTNKHDGLVEHWYCYGKIRRRNCKAKNIRGDRLRKACCEVLGLEEFDEGIFGKTIDKILVTDKLEFHFYDGTVKTAQIQFFKTGQGKYTDPHKKPFGYQWSNEKGYVIVPKEADAVKLIFQYYMEGRQITDISKELESKGYGSIRGKISRKLVAYVLDSDFYLGTRHIKAQFSESGHDEVIENDHEPLISREMFETVQKRRDSECRRWKGRERNAKRDGDTRQPE